MTKTAEKLSSRVSIVERREIEAPDSYVSVFHETTAEAIAGIDLHGLQTGRADRNIGAAGAVVQKNKLIDSDRPDYCIDLGLSRSTNVYAYPYLSDGHGLSGADQRFVTQERTELDDRYEALKKYGVEVLTSMGVATADEFADQMRDPNYLKQQYPGEIIELKVDPARCFVRDLTKASDLFENISRWGYEPGDAKFYWESLISLEDFLKWYKKPEWSEDGNSIKSPEQFRDGDLASANLYCAIAGAPDDYPWSIMQPEILIPDDVPQEHIRLVH